jgi:CRP/FNR family cyclic AMP-dependent transcriptional regulator
VSGLVEVTVGNGTRSKRVAKLGPGEVFGEMSLLEPGPRSATVTAVKRTECTVTSYDEFLATIQEDPQKAVVFMRTLVRRIRQTNELLASLDPQKRGIRELLADMQKSVSLQETDMAKVDWYDWSGV